jgi:hypothetical protein
LERCFAVHQRCVPDAQGATPSFERESLAK